MCMPLSAPRGGPAARDDQILSHARRRGGRFRALGAERTDSPSSLAHRGVARSGPHGRAEADLRPDRGNAGRRMPEIPVIGWRPEAQRAKIGSSHCDAVRMARAHLRREDRSRHDTARRFGGGRPQAGRDPPTGPRAVAADPAERRGPALRRRDVGGPRPRGARRLRAEAARQGRQGALLPRAARRGPRDPRGQGVRPGPGGQRAHRRPAAGRAAARPRRQRRRPHDGRVPHRRHPQARPAAAQGQEPAVGVPRRRRLHPHAAAEPPVPARQHRLRLPGAVGQPDDEARAQARDGAQPGDLELPPEVQGRGAALLLRQRRHPARAGHRRGRRHPGRRQRRRDDRHGRADDPAGHRHAGAGVLLRPARPDQQDHRGGAAEDPRLHAPRHRDDDDRQGQVLRLPVPPGAPEDLHAHQGRRLRRLRHRRERRPVAGARRGRRRRRRCTR